MVVSFPRPKPVSICAAKNLQGADSHLQSSLRNRAKVIQTVISAPSLSSVGTKELSVHFSKEPKLSPRLMFKDFQEQ